MEKGARKWGRRRKFSPIDPGTSPGVLRGVEDAQPTRLRYLGYDADEVEEGEADAVEEIASHRRSTGDGVLWVDVSGLRDAAVIEAVGTAFGVHPLALEDILNLGQRSKVEEYPNGLFVIASRAVIEEPGAIAQVCLFVADGLVISFREREAIWVDAIRQRIRVPGSRLRSNGSDYLAYALLDSIVDHAFPVIQHYEDRLESLETSIIEGRGGNCGPEIQLIRHDLLLLRKAIWPMREAVATMLRGEAEVITSETLVFLRDCHDHAIRSLELVDTYRELAGDLLDFQLADVSTRMNEVMQTLTVIATLFIPLGFIAGLYGMNFDPEISPFNMPELGWYFGYPFALGLMGAVSLGLISFFWRKGWIGSRG